MTMPAASIIDATSGIPQADYGRSADGFLVARLGDTAFAILPARDGRHYLAPGWCIRCPIAEWTRSDFDGHAGFHLARERNRKVHSMLRAEGGWYEEDAAWAIVALSFPYLFTSFECRCAERTIKNSWPCLGEHFRPRAHPGESYQKDRRSFRSQARVSQDCGHPWRQARGRTAERRFLVPSAEYRGGRFDFVIDDVLSALARDRLTAVGRR